MHDRAVRQDRQVLRVDEEAQVQDSTTHPIRVVSGENLVQLVNVARERSVKGWVISNTSSRHEQFPGLENDTRELGKGGVSGRPLTQLSNQMIKKIHAIAGPDMPIIGVGGIFTSRDADEKFNAGASLVQVYTGLIYQGPGLVRQIVRNLPMS